MKKILLIGKSGCGKTTLCQRIFRENIEYKKTQSVEVVGGSAIDTPGEYMEHKQYYRALVVTAADAELVLLVQSATDEEWNFSPRISSMFNKPIIGIITKTDLPTEEWKVKQFSELLEYAGAERVFRVSAYTGEGIRELTDFLTDDGQAVPS